jgi:site-specific recombinase XerD
MTLKELAENYIAFRKSLGERCEVNGHVVRSFCRIAGQDASIDEIPHETVNGFLAGKGALTASWHVKYNALSGFWKYLLSRGFAVASPLPSVIPKRPPAFAAYIYTQDELRRLFAATDSYQHNRGHLNPLTVRTILLLLYGAALRSSEALALTFADVDLDAAVLTVRESKFFKSRLVPLGSNLTQQMRAYSNWRSANWRCRAEDTPFFCNRYGQRICLNTLQYNFERLRMHAGLHRDGGPRCQPRMHDLRHTSAVHRLISCYRQGDNVQKYLEHLSVYMGHAKLSGTQTYLSMTAELLAQANDRFERYAGKEAEL